MKKLIYAVPAFAAVASFAGETSGGDAATVDWGQMASTAQSELTTVASALIPMVAAVVAMVAGARLLAKLINRAVGK